MAVETTATQTKPAIADYKVQSASAGFVSVAAISVARLRANITNI
ncbi:MAG TPA: hypothetical protein V6C78_00520 [Crinalium sp.]